MKQFATDMFNGGTEGQVFGKNSNADFDMGWRDTSGGGSGYRQVWLSDFEIFQDSLHPYLTESRWVIDLSITPNWDLNTLTLVGSTSIMFDIDEVHDVSAKDIPSGVIPFSICDIGPFYGGGDDDDIFGYAYDVKFNDPVTDRGNYFSYGLTVTMNEDAYITGEIGGVYGVLTPDADTGVVTASLTPITLQYGSYYFHDAIRMMLITKGEDGEIDLGDKDAAFFIEVKSGARLWVTCNVSDTPPTE